ncbi:HAMP domain-containing protein [Brevibacillus sp. SYP-B805]|uniref:sensor histidine kinase n=1 Tax=Brevibacillus sp. SYP-B805 TaxID=1578199 RepID=UPI0013ED2309|nr:ATP-binding protein [Brevibacillus sp. SYP-B805]NGQ93604.1 HAMP domain-containing protein [Brevibacillus sp. SYP-B805]
MKHFTHKLQQLPIVWKLTIWSSFLMVLLFTAYNAMQYYVMNTWMYKQEETRIRQTSSQIKAFFLDTKRDPITEITRNSTFFSSLNEKDQFIRILDENGNVIFTIENQLSANWVPAQSTDIQYMMDYWHEDDHLLIIRTPFAVDTYKGTIEIARNLENFDDLNHVILFFYVLGGIGAIILSGLGGYIISRQLVKPIKIMINTMQKIRSERNEGLALRVQLFHNRDEFSELAAIFNGMMDSLEDSFHQQKQFVEDASHELRTPISIIEGHLSLLHRWGKSDPKILEESLTLALEETKRLKSIVMELLELSRAEIKPNLQMVKPIHPLPVITKVIQNFSILYPDFTFHTDLQLNQDHYIAITAHHFEQILLILLDNAVKYSASQKTIEILGKEEEGHILLTVKDYGQGIPKMDLPKIFNRFYRADKARSRAKSGVGLGLSIAYRLVTNYKGDIHVESREGVGTSFTMKFPSRWMGVS